MTHSEVYLWLKLYDMKKLIFALFFIGSLVSSCSEDSMDIPPQNEVYYVSYTIQGTGSYGHFSDWTATTPDGTYSNSGYQVRSWSETYGPVEKGFKCSVQIDNYIWDMPTIDIRVSKNDGPFVSKASVKGTTATYIID